MAQEIPEIKIGTTMNELRNYVQKQTNLSESARNSIFNMIQDEEQFGDGKVTNKIELSMILGFLRGGKAEMPEHLQADDEGATTEFGQEVKTVTDKIVQSTTVTKGEESDIFTTSKDMKSNYSKSYSREYRVDSGDVIDAVSDNDNDGVADDRYVRKTLSDNKDVVYVDENADGKFDIKDVVTENGVASYIRDENGKWIPYTS